MGELVCLNVGQAGVQIGNAIWELYCLEHCVLPNGTPAGQDPGRRVIFAESKAGHCMPRAVLCDLDPTCIDEIRIGPYRHLFGMDFLVSGKEDAASNYARGYYSLGNEYSELVAERLRRQAERCEGLRGLLVFRSFGGGTGSGLTPNVLNKVRRDFPKISILEFSVYPSPRISTVIVEPYNAVLTAHATMETTQCNFLFDNEAIYNICEKSLDVKQPTYTNLNRLIAQVVSATTCSIRFPCEPSSSSSSEFDEIVTNLVPYPRLHFPLVSFAPLTTNDKLAYETISPGELLTSSFNPSSQMVMVDPQTGKYLSVVLLFRGDVSPTEVNDAVGKLKETQDVKFVDYSPTGFKVSSCGQPMRYVFGADLGASPASLVGMSSCTALGVAWDRLTSKFDLLFSRRAFVHHYVGEGMEEAEFTEAREDIGKLFEAYQEAAAADLE